MLQFGHDFEMKLTSLGTVRNVQEWIGDTFV